MAANPRMYTEPLSTTPLRWLPEFLWLVISRHSGRGAGTETATPQGRAEAPQAPGTWLEDALDELCNLPWDRPDWSSENPEPVSISAVAELALILLEMMPEHGIPPQISPNWSGGAMAVWELGDLCLEIETAPNFPAQYSYVDERDGLDFGEEKDVSGNADNLRRWLNSIADATAQWNR